MFGQGYISTFSVVFLLYTQKKKKKLINEIHVFWYLIWEMISLIGKPKKKFSPPLHIWYKLEELCMSFSTLIQTVLFASHQPSSVLLLL